MKRSSFSSRRRLSIEFLEDRAVPAATNDIVTPDPTSTTTSNDVVVVQPINTSGPATDTVTTTDTTPTASPLDGHPPVTPVDLAIFATVDKLKPSIGDVVNVKITVNNAGSVPATGVNVMDVLPAGLTLVSAKPGQGTVGDDGSWNVGSVFPGGPVTLTLKAKVTDPAQQDVSASITAANEPDPNSDNNAASVSMTPVLAQLSMTQKSSAKVLTTGGVVTFTITVRNKGQGAATAVSIGEALAPGLKFLRAQVLDRGSFNAKTMTWKLKTLPAGKSATLLVTAMVAKTGALDSVSTLLDGAGIDMDNTQSNATGTVKGTSSSSPSTWSYSLPGFTPGQAMQPSTLTIGAAKPMPTFKGGVQLASIMKLTKPSL